MMAPPASALKLAPPAVMSPRLARDSALPAPVASRVDGPPVDALLVTAGRLQLAPPLTTTLELSMSVRSGRLMSPP